MIMKLCDHAGCHELVPFNVKYCAQHAGDYKARAAPGNAASYQHRKEISGKLQKFYKSKAWEHLSYDYRLKYPMCEWCQKKGLFVSADVVDHIIPIRVDWTKRLDESNLQSLCNSCHWQKSQEDKKRYHLPKLGTPPE
ncbi:HNH endonuclease [Schleiferilactobacillus harbinensis]|nr:HNH endonuclease [Schleiferilactobacillus harbinensis]